MRVLGISPLDKDATASIVEDGKILYAAGEERFTRVKQQTGFPWKALEAGLNMTGIKPEEFDAVCYAFFPYQKEAELFKKSLEAEKKLMTDSELQPDLQRQLNEAEKRVPDRTYTIPGLTHPNEKMQKGTLKTLFYKLAGNEGVISRNIATRTSKEWSNATAKYHQKWQEELETSLDELGILPKLKRFEHHISHAANAYLTSGFDRTLVVTLDGYGSGLAGSISLGEGGKLKRLHNIEYPHSLGTFYEFVTSSLGYKPGRHEGKIVGLAAYGDPAILKDILLSRFIQTPGDFRMIESTNVFFSRHLSTQFPKIDIAAAYQSVLEIVACNLIHYWVQKTGVEKVVLSGGVTANVKLNQRIYEIDGVKNIFVYPNMGDGGCGTGVGLLHSWPGHVQESIKSAYYGPSFTDKEIEDELTARQLSFQRPKNLAEEVALRIHNGEVVARFDGRMEYGPRALGNRSILYHAKEPEVNQWLNQRLGRTEFMPFAPVTLWEARDRCYQNIRGVEHAAEFMTVTLDCTDWMKENCPAAVHIDGTARPQLIQREVNPGYYDIVAEYEKLSGIPCLINTSFNMHEEPIVCSPHDAVKAFLQGNLDVLAIGPFLVEHPTGVAHKSS